MSERVRYTRELLAEAARCCTDIDEVIVFCGGHSYHQVRRHLLKRFDHFGIDVSHFRPVVRGAKHPRPTRESLQQAADASVSVAAALRHLGIADTARSRSLFRSWVSAEGISTTHFLGQAHMRGKPGRTPPRSPEDILVKHHRKRRAHSAMLRRALLQTDVPERCSACGTDPVWNGRPMTLEIDHINGDWRDDRSENLRLLCPNCHAITDTWCRGGRRRRQPSGAS
ncbi:HNH endonuclease [Streptomyces sp. NPDC050161]|uniref:HNH endonuclease n=1 Tax=Streptomyces sp. NPDC050161 TaxID=3365604 RepID=UPI003795D25A